MLKHVKHWIRRVLGQYGPMDDRQLVLFVRVLAQAAPSTIAKTRRKMVEAGEIQYSRRDRHNKSGQRINVWEIAGWTPPQISCKDRAVKD